MLRRSDFSPKQLEVVDIEKIEENLIIVDGAGRSGKTAAIAFALLRYSTLFDTPTNFLLFSKDLPKIKNVMIAALRLAADSMGIDYGEYRNQEKFIQIGKHRFFAFSAEDANDLESIRGFEFASAWGDEVTAVNHEFVQVVWNRFSNPEQAGKLIMSCNPSSPMHWVKTEYIDKAEELGYRRIRFFWTDNPSLPEDWEAKQRQVLRGALLQQLLYSEWVATEGLVYPHITKYNNKIDGEVDARYISFDVGWDAPTHALMIELIDGIFYVSDELRIINKDNPLSPSRQGELIMEWKGDREVDAWIIDSAAADMKAQMLQDHGVYCINSVKDKKLGVQITRIMLSNADIQINMNCEGLLKELGSYLFDPKRMRLSIHEPMKGNDHACDALRYFCATVQRNIVEDERPLMV